jgi:radical SAM protein with 4Fe4S-binding SPASM domain
MSFDEFRFILNSFISVHLIPRVVVLYHGGEPLLNKNLEEFVVYSKNIGVKKTVITTNASLLNEKRSQSIIKSGLDEMKVSFDGRSQEENDAIRKGGKFSKDAINVLTLLKMKREMGVTHPDVIISTAQILDKDEMIDTDEQYMNLFSRSPEYLTNYFSEFKDEAMFRTFPAMVWPMSKINSKYSFRRSPILRTRNDYCAELFEYMSIMSNGDVVSCCYDISGKVVHGNIFQADPVKIWHGESYSEFRNSFRTGRYGEMCSSCVYSSGCYLHYV